MVMDIDSKPPVEGSILSHRRKIKTSELPLNAAQRSSIDSLLHTIKKKGDFDSVRKRVWSQYTESVSSTSCHDHFRTTNTLPYSIRKRRS